MRLKWTYFLQWSFVFRTGNEGPSDSTIKTEATSSDEPLKRESGYLGRKTLSSIKFEQQDDADIERSMVELFADRSLILPTNSKQVGQKIEKNLNKPVSNESLFYYLQKLSAQHMITIKGN